MGCEYSPDVIFIEVVPSPPPYPKHTIDPIFIARFPPPISSQPPPSTPLPPPLFTATATTTSTTTSVRPFVNVNTSYAAAKTSRFTTSTTSLVSPQQHGSEDVLGEEDFDFETFQYNPFSIQDDSDKDAPITQKDLKALNKKMDSILASSTISSSKAYSEATVKGMLDTLVKEHAANFDKANKAVENSTQSCL
ncbi:unnamed protein product [Lactuca saligna]|uniref:Uncharacterized protein n=1 Tax=Lactuca saligna TaxID=75948 RepID=A0AA36EK94_LACSI|nr:unnamed protein product [Lactuca saligna]